MKLAFLSLLAILGTGIGITHPQIISSKNPTNSVVAQSLGEEGDKTQTVEVTGAMKASIYQQITTERSRLNLCADEDELTSRLDDIRVYGQDDSLFLVQVLCFNAAYQGVYEFVSVDFNQYPPTLDKANVTLVGYPYFDPDTNVISNSYKFTGAGTCYETSEHYWDGYSVQLIYSAIEDGIPNGCEDLGVNVPYEDYLITAKGVGLAQLGMTLGELKSLLSDQHQFIPYQWGVDLPSGLMMQFYGEDQFALIFDNIDPGTGEQFPITDSSIIRALVVRNPQYRTPEGVGPGTLLSEATQNYGPVSLSYNWDMEGREYINFEEGLLGNENDNGISWISMRSNQGTLTQFAGIYPEDIYSSSYQTTDRYHDHGAINSIEIMMDL